jgi:aerobic-type carbon monoxide dehydrogenase small subunit (CoxS/CutS family)
MATVGGEAIHASPDSEVVAALLALNAIFVVRRTEGLLEVPALRFLRNPRQDLAGGGLVTEIILPGRPGGAALERVAVLPSAPPLLAVAATVTLAGDCCTRARVALTGLSSSPSRVLEAEARLEGREDTPAAVGEYVEQALERALFRDDAHASAGYRRAAARALITRALGKAMERARSETPLAVPRLRPRVRARVTGAPRFEAGRLEIRVNGNPRSGAARAGDSLLAWLRGQGFWSVKHGCESGECGACTVLLDRQPVSACLTLAARAEGRQVQTVEGLGSAEALHPVQAAFVETGAIQCGYCTPAMELSAVALLEAVSDPTEQEIRDALAGCLCRCTGYVKPVEAVSRAARARVDAEKARRRNRAFPAPKSR